MDKLYEVKEKLMDEIEEYASKSMLSKDDALTLKALTGAADHLCNLIENKDMEGNSGFYPYYMRSYRGRNSYRGQKRDSMGRYSGDDEELHGMIDGMSRDEQRIVRDYIKDMR